MRFQCIRHAVLSVSLILAAVVLALPILAGNTVPRSVRSVLAADLTPAPLDVRGYLPLIAAGQHTLPGPRTVQLPAAATWRLFSTGNSYAEALAGANLLVDGPGYPFAEVGQYHTHWDQYYVEKDFLAFDTVAIPASASVLTATLVISGCTAVQADRPFQIELYQATVGDALTGADWNAYGGAQLASFASVACGAPLVELSLEPGIVTPGTATRLALVTDRIRLGQNPARDQGDTVQIPTAAGAVSLRVTYKER